MEVDDHTPSMASTRMDADLEPTQPQELYEQPRNIWHIDGDDEIMSQSSANHNSTPSRDLDEVDMIDTRRTANAQSIGDHGDELHMSQSIPRPNGLSAEYSSGEEVDMIQIVQEPRSRSSSSPKLVAVENYTEENNTVITPGLDPIRAALAQKANSQKRTSSGRFVRDRSRPKPPKNTPEAIQAASQARDSKGRFGSYIDGRTPAPKRTPKPRAPSPKREYITRLGSKSDASTPITPAVPKTPTGLAFSQKASSQARDSRGRFGPSTSDSASQRPSSRQSRSVSNSQKGDANELFGSENAVDDGANESFRGRTRSLASSSQKRDPKGRSGPRLPSEEDAFATPEQQLGSEDSRSRSRSLKASLQKRDDKGRFGSGRKATETPVTSSEQAPRCDDSRSRSRSLNASLQKRDNKGRFGSGRKAANTPATASEKDSRSRSRSLNASSQKRDNKGRFGSGHLIPETPSPTRSEGFQPQSTAVKSDQDRHELESESRRRSLSSAQKRDNKGRFGSGQAAKEASSARSEEVQSQPDGSKTDPFPDNESFPKQAKDEPIEKDKSKTSTPKLKKAPSKSPYFTPSKTSKVLDSVPTIEREAQPFPTSPRKRSSSTSPETPTSSQQMPKRSRTPGGIVSCIPFPPLASPHFGLIQEKLAPDPFRLLIAVTFLIRTHGKHAIPVFFELIEKYPTPESLVAADKDDIVHVIRHLGLQNQRASTYQMYARIWLENPPIKGKRYAVRGYPSKDSGRDIPKDEIINDEDKREAWEIGHMTQGPYAIDSWRIFCRDVCRGVAEGWNGEGTELGFQPEWMRVQPEDKELRAYLRWMWLKEGFEWDPFTGEREVASRELMEAAIEGRIAWDERGGMRMLDEVPQTPGPSRPISPLDGSPSRARTSMELVSPSSSPEFDGGDEMVFEG
jgi:methyl-CpG-binding domain protein 4